MKKAIVVFCLAVMSSSAFAAIRCEVDRRGNQCCWDTKVDGPFKPLSCI